MEAEIIINSKFCEHWNK